MSNHPTPTNITESSQRVQILENLSARSLLPEFHENSGAVKKPDWLKTGITHGDKLFEIKKDLREKKLFTVCEEAKCPNISQCWNSGTATFMIMGDTCTRACRFCHVKTGNPEGLLDTEEPFKVALSIKKMNLSYAVITMVDRDDLPDGGASHIAACLSEIQKENPKVVVEILSGDFQGNRTSLEKILYAGRGLQVFAHNVETVERLTPRVRDARATFKQSLGVLKAAKELKSNVFTKSGIMLGLGETLKEVEETLHILREIEVDILTIGQYMQPTKKHLSIKRFAHPDEFEYWKTYAKEIGFKAVASGPLVRSSFKAADLLPLFHS